MCPFFFFNDTATTEIYTLSLHDALPISPGRRRRARPRRLRRGEHGQQSRVGRRPRRRGGDDAAAHPRGRPVRGFGIRDRKSTRLNSSHLVISYAVFCLKKKTI